MSGVRWQDVPVPERMGRLATDKIGRPVPWFVAWFGGEPDFRIIAPGRMAEALSGNLCWLCGQQIIGSYVGFVAGPLAAVNRASPEPPGHVNCAEYAARVCPFLTHPGARRRESALPTTKDPAGEMIRRNPGVCLVWVTRKFDVWYPRPNDGPLIRMGDPIDVFWFRMGRRAYRFEVLSALAAGLPDLRRAAMIDGPRAVAQLDGKIRVARSLIPADESPTTPPKGVENAQ